MSRMPCPLGGEIQPSRRLFLHLHLVELPASLLVAWRAVLGATLLFGVKRSLSRKGQALRAALTWISALSVCHLTSIKAQETWHLLSASKIGSGPGEYKHSRVDADYPSPISSSITHASSSHVDVQQLVDSHERKQGCSVAEIHQRRNSLERLSETQTSRNNMEKKEITSQTELQGRKGPKKTKNKRRPRDGR